jgi:hypothetical protein
MRLFGTDPGSAGAAVYDYRQQWQQNPRATPNPRYPAVNYLRKALGDDNLNDFIDATDVAKDMPPFLLISRGPTRQFSTDAEIKGNFAACPEITNLQH